MKKHFCFQSLLVLSVCLTMFSCQKETITPQDESEGSNAEMLKSTSQKQNRYYGTLVTLGNGTAQSFITLNPSGKPMEMGIELTKSALQGLPTGHGEYSYILRLPEEAKATTPYNHIYMNWNPSGHEPNHVYTVPHFDFHFYRTTVEEREAIPVYSMAEDKFQNFPSLNYLPANYFAPPGGVPKMGKHWLDRNAPELNGGNFTYTFIYGTYDGKVTFTEPMITKAVLESGSRYRLDIPQPADYAVTNTYYPVDYNIYTDKSSQKIYVTYSNFKKR